MSENSTKVKITDKQLKAVELLITGKTITDTAKAVSVSRETVSSWVNHDAEFQAYLNRQRAHLWQSFEDRLRSLVPDALKVVEDSLGDADLKTALAILKMSAFRIQPIGKTEASEIEFARSLAW
jgi:DNA-binding CsgD family transcriptional regulator